MFLTAIAVVRFTGVDRSLVEIETIVMHPTLRNRRIGTIFVRLIINTLRDTSLVRYVFVAALPSSLEFWLKGIFGSFGPDDVAATALDVECRSALASVFRRKGFVYPLLYDMSERKA